MSELAKAFASSKKQEKRTKSLFNNIFSSPIFRGFYEKETPEVDIKLTGSDLEKKRLTYLINTIARNSPTGKKVLQEAAKAGYTLGFERQKGSYGFCEPKKKVFMLNPVIGDNKLMTTLAHEARHVQQENAFGVSNNIGDYDVATELKLRRATEADAQAVSALVALEICAATKQEKIWNSFKQSDPVIARSVKVPTLSMSPNFITGNQGVFMAEAFEGWFKDSFMLRSYEEAYLYGPLTSISKASDKEKLEIFEESPFDKHMTSQEIVNLVCRTTDGKCYLEHDQDILNGYRMASVSKETKDAADVFFEERRKLTGKPADTSYQDLPEGRRLFRYSSLPSMPDIPNAGSKELKSSALSAPLIAALKNRRQH